MIANGNKERGQSLKEKIDIRKFRSFGAETVEEYQDKINGLNIVDLCAHALKYVLNPNIDRRRVEKVLVDQFKKSKAAFQVALSNLDPIQELSEEKKERIRKTLDFIRTS